jgi:hypothetical protein
MARGISPPMSIEIFIAPDVITMLICMKNFIIQDLNVRSVEDVLITMLRTILTVNWVDYYK